MSVECIVYSVAYKMQSLDPGIRARLANGQIWRYPYKV